MAHHAERILIAEDDPVVRLLLVNTLEDNGFDVLAAEDGTAALMLMDNPDRVDVLVTDINMGLFDGIVVAEQVRKDHPKVKVLFISGHPEQLVARRLSGPYRFLAKPFTMAELRARRGADGSALTSPTLGGTETLANSQWSRTK